MRARPLAGAALAAVLVVSGCGVPSNSGVVDQGPGIQATPASGDDGTNEPPGRTATNDPSAFVLNFLAAAAGKPEAAPNRVRAFLMPELRSTVTDTEVVRVIRLNGDPIVNQTRTGYDVTVPATVLGELGEYGKFTPVAAAPATFEFTLASVNAERQTGLFVTEAPDPLLLSDDALERYFELRPIYFWSTDGRYLVPDLRYLPSRDISKAQRPTEIIEWLLSGPSPWLLPAVQPLPDDAAAVGKVPVPTDGVLRVELAKAADTKKEEQIRRLATQLRWSLRSGTDTSLPLSLKIDQVQRSFTDADYLTANAAYRNGPEPARYGLVDGKVRVLTSPEESAAAPEVPAEWNGQVVRAAIATDDEWSLAALVRATGDRLQLNVAGVPGPLASFRRITLPAGPVGQPVWLPGDDHIGLLTVGGRLYSFRSASGSVDLVPGAPAGITAFSVPPDGRRLAYVSQGRLYVAPLLHTGGSGGGRPTRQPVTVGGPREVSTALTALTAVGWSQQDWLVVAGQQADGLVGFQDVTVDGAVQGEPRVGQFGTQSVVHLVAATDDPVTARGPGQVMYVANNNLAYELFSQPRRLTADDVAEPPANQAAEADPTYPFFLG